MHVCLDGEAAGKLVEDLDRPTKPQTRDRSVAQPACRTGTTAAEGCAVYRHSFSRGRATVAPAAAGC